MKYKVFQHDECGAQTEEGGLNVKLITYWGSYDKMQEAIDFVDRMSGSSEDVKTFFIMSSVE